MSIRRRELLGVAGGLILGGIGAWAAQRYLLPPTEQPPEYEPTGLCPVGSGRNLSAEEALERLKAGNRRFLEGRTQYRAGFNVPPHVLARSYCPFAVIVCCSDARIASEILFDERVSELFVVRQAAHVLDEGARMSIEFAVNYLDVQLVVVLGHSGCKTLEAALAADAPGAQPPAYLDRLRTELNTVVKEVAHQPGEKLENAVAANVRFTVRQLRGSLNLQPLLREGRLRIQGARYTLPPGEIDFLDVP